LCFRKGEDRVRHFTFLHEALKRHAVPRVRLRELLQRLSSVGANFPEVLVEVARGSVIRVGGKNEIDDVLKEYRSLVMPGERLRVIVCPC
jgi:hypothetical protein